MENPFIKQCLEDRRAEVFALAFSPDGKILAAGGTGTDTKYAEVTFWYSEGAGMGPDP
jgi:hypothetical protein